MSATAFDPPTRPMPASWREVLCRLDKAFAEAERLGIETAEGFEELVVSEAEAAGDWAGGAP